MSITDQQRAHVSMSDAEITELTREGWPAEIIASLRTRGFRPCETDHIAARFDGADPKKTRGFIRQTALPHLHITLERHGTMREMLERIDTAIFETGLRVGHEGLADMFMRFFESCKTWRLSPAPAALETHLVNLTALSAIVKIADERLAALETHLVNLTARLAKLEATHKANVPDQEREGKTL